MNMRELLIGTAIAVYVSGFVASFGHAYVESKEYTEEHCASYHPEKPADYKACVSTSLIAVEAMFKSGVWPLWVSYQIAKK